MDVLLVDDLHPEDVAMLQALYSRSAESVKVHLDQVAERGSGDFMSKYYVGYGHKSIGDCGSTYLFLEDVSMLAAKAVQDNPLYSGQETSTRYIDFSKQGFFDPVGTDASKVHLENMVAFYTECFEATLAWLQTSLENPDPKKPGAWKRALTARAFDITRSFLPTAMKTQLSWATNLRQASDHVERLLAHPLGEVRDVAGLASDKLHETYKNSFKIRERKDDARGTYRDVVSHQGAYTAPNDSGLEFGLSFNLDQDMLARFETVLTTRPKGMELPRTIQLAGTARARFLLDFGSFRDIQRHRGAMMTMPLVTDAHGFEDWYLEQLPPAMLEKATAHLETVFQSARDLKAAHDLSDAELQYFYPMGMKVDCDAVFDLAELAYVCELRSGATVHPTLRTLSLEWGAALLEAVPNMMLYLDHSPDELNVKRGDQDIFKKEGGIAA